MYIRGLSRAVISKFDASETPICAIRVMVEFLIKKSNSDRQRFDVFEAALIQCEGSRLD